MANYSTTLTATYTSPLNDVERIKGFNKKFVIPYSFVANASATTATDTVTVTLGATPDQWLVDKAAAYISTAFAGSTGGITMNVGSTSSTSAFITAQSVKTIGALGMASTLPILTNATATASVNLVAVFTGATADSLSLVTAGSVTVLVNIDSLTSSTFTA